MAHERELKEAIKTIKAGNTKSAGVILHDILKQERDNELAWLWMSACVNTPDDRKYCLEQVLRINPKNISAQHALQQLLSAGGQPAGQPAAAPAAIGAAQPDEQDTESPAKVSLSTKASGDHVPALHTETRLCPFCKTPVPVKQVICPHCRRDVRLRAMSRDEIAASSYDFLSWLLLPVILAALGLVIWFFTKLYLP